MDGRLVLLFASLFLAFDRFSVGLWADLEAMFAPTGLFSHGLDWSPFTSYPAIVYSAAALAALAATFALAAAALALAAAALAAALGRLRATMYIGLWLVWLVVLLLGLRSCLPSAIRVWLEDPTDGLAARWNDPMQLAAAASPTWEVLRWIAALLNVCWVGLSLCAFHRLGARDDVLVHGRGGVRRVPALMVVLIVLLSGVLVSMLALLARADDEGAVSGDEAEEGGSSIVGNWT